MKDGIHILRIDKGEGSSHIEAVREHKGVVEHEVVADASLRGLIHLAIPPKADDAHVSGGGREIIRLKGGVASVVDGKNIRLVVAEDHTLVASLKLGWEDSATKGYSSSRTPEGISCGCSVDACYSVSLRIEPSRDAIYIKSGVLRASTPDSAG